MYVPIHPFPSYPSTPSIPLTTIFLTGKAPLGRQKRNRRRPRRRLLGQRGSKHGTSRRGQIPRRLHPKDIQRARSGRQDRHQRRHCHQRQRHQRSQRRRRRHKRGGYGRQGRRGALGGTTSRVVPTPREVFRILGNGSMGKGSCVMDGWIGSMMCSITLFSLYFTSSSTSPSSSSSASYV